MDHITTAKQAARKYSTNLARKSIATKDVDSTRTKLETSPAKRAVDPADIALDPAAAAAAAAATLLATWITRGPELLAKYSGHTEIAGRLYDYTTAHGQKMCDDLEECVLAFAGVRVEQREDDEFVESLISGVGASAAITPPILRGRYDELVEDKKYLMAVLAARFVVVRGKSSIPKVGHARLRLLGQSGLKKILFVPTGVVVDEEKIQELVKPKHWNMKLPNICTTFDFGNCHPTAFASSQLCASDQFSEVAEIAEMMGRDPEKEIQVRCV
jgi:hypothetical protein